MHRALPLAPVLLGVAVLAAPLAAAPAAEPGIVLAQAAAYTTIDLQRALARAGYYDGAIDGLAGPGTRRAIASFQRDHGLTVTGNANASLLRTLHAQGYLPDPSVAAAPRGTQPTVQRDDLVADVQSALRQRGYGVGAVTGYLDTDTRSAIRSYQRSQGLPATGQPSPELLALLEGDTATTTAQRTLSRDELVREVEQRLANKGYDVGPINTTLEPKSQDAVRAYQSQRGLPQTGAVTPELLADLEQSGITAQQALTPRTPEDAVGDVLRGLGNRAVEELGR